MTDKANKPVLSLCIPTNGVKEWILPVLDSIYASNEDNSKFEVVIMDNGNNHDFQTAIEQYQKNHGNLEYYQSKAAGFLCQIDCLKKAKGEFIKFVNHRYLFLNGAVEFLIDYAEENIENKPVTFFSNGNLNETLCKTFDEYVRNLSHYSSWSGGLALWKKDLDFLAQKDHFNALFPHADILFADRDAQSYMISNRKLFSEIPTGHAAKGKYNLFYAFAVEYPSIINELLRDHDISVDTFLSVKKDLLGFIADCYLDFIIRKKEASYTLDHYREYINVYYSQGALKRKTIHRILNRIKMRLFPRNNKT